MITDERLLNTTIYFCRIMSQQIDMVFGCENLVRVAHDQLDEYAFDVYVAD